MNYIQENTTNVHTAKLELFDTWTDIDESSSMAKLASALVVTGYKNLANNIWKQYPGKVLNLRLNFLIHCQNIVCKIF